MDILIDAMGGDNAPGEIVRGVADASLRTKSKLILFGNKTTIENHLRGIPAKRSSIEIVHTNSAITMDDDPRVGVRNKKDSSMTVGLHALRDGGDAFISAGNTGALHVSASLIVRTVRGVQRAAIATVLPFPRPILLLDCGANVNVTADYLVQWAVMGSVYMNRVLDVKRPEVGLLNNGTEDHKGTQVQIDTYQRLAGYDSVRFVGNVEAKQLYAGPCDVLVTDGFSGNIMLKTIEGMSTYFFSVLKDLYSKNPMTKLSFVAVKNGLRDVKSSFDAGDYGGAPLLGLQKTVIKAHGSSDARAIQNAVRQAEAAVRNGVISEITREMGVMVLSAPKPLQPDNVNTNEREESET